MRRRLIALGAVAALAGTVPAAGQSITVALNADIRSTSPGVNRDDNTDAVVLHMVEGLVGYRENGSVGPLLAEEVSMSPDRLTYTFRLRHGVTFHNGAALTAEDVLWSWRRYADPKTEWRCLAEIDGRNGLKVEAVEAPDPFTVTMRINRPSALFLDTLARTDCGMAGILHRSSVKDDGSWNGPVGTGPYRLGEWKRGQSLTLTRFDGYVTPAGDKPDGYAGLKTPRVQEVRLLVVPDPATVKSGLRSGAIDVAPILDTDAAELQAVPNLAVQTSASAVKTTLLFQTRDPLLGNAKLRQAIAYALDYTQLVAAASGGFGEVNNSAIPPGSDFSDAVQKTGYAYDPAKAQRLLKDAGYKGEPIRMLVNKRPNMPSFQVAIVAQAMMQAVGINAELDVLDWATQLDRYNRGNYQMMSFSYSSRLDPALSYEQFTGPKATQPRKVWDDPEVQALLEQASTVSDHAERQRLFDEIHRRQLAATPLVILYNGTETWGTSRRVSGFSPWEGKLRLWSVRLAP